MSSPVIKYRAAAAARILTVSKLPRLVDGSASVTKRTAPGQSRLPYLVQWPLKVRKLLSSIALKCHSMRVISGCSRGFSVRDHSI